MVCLKVFRTSGWFYIYVGLKSNCSCFSVLVLKDILAYQRRSTHRLVSGLYLGYLKLSSSVDQIKVLVSQRTPNMLCHTRIRDNANVSRFSHTHQTRVSELQIRSERTVVCSEGR